MAITKRNIKEIGESLDNMGKNDRPSILTLILYNKNLKNRYQRVAERERVTGQQMNAKTELV